MAEEKSNKVFQSYFRNIDTNLPENQTNITDENDGKYVDIDDYGRFERPRKRNFNTDNGDYKIQYEKKSKIVKHTYNPQRRVPMGYQKSFDHNRFIVQSSGVNNMYATNPLVNEGNYVEIMNPNNAVAMLF